MRRPHPDGGPDISDEPPKPPPFAVGTRLRMKPGPHAFDAYVQNPKLPYPDREKRENLVRIRGAGIEVVICRVREGHRGTGKVMETQDDGYEVYDSTKDGWSIYEQTDADGRTIPHSGRAIAPEDAEHWEVIQNVSVSLEEKLAERHTGLMTEIHKIQSQLEGQTYFAAGVLAGAYAAHNAPVMLRHAVSGESFKAGRLARECGEALCNRKLNLVDRHGWDPVEKVTCPACADTLARVRKVRP